MPRSSINKIKLVLEGEDSTSWAGFLSPQEKAGAEDLPVQSPYTSAAAQSFVLRIKVII